MVQNSLSYETCDPLVFKTPIALTVGEPAGIGPEISLKAVQQWCSERNLKHSPLVLVGDLDFLKQTAIDLNLMVDLIESSEFNQALLSVNESLDQEVVPAKSAIRLRVPVYHIPLLAPVQAGVLNVDNALHVLNLLDAAIAGALSKQYSAIVTAPIQKSVISDNPHVHFKFTGHTEYLAEKTHTDQVVMMLVGGGMRVALATTHLPLSQVASAITQESLRKIITIILHDLTHKMGIARPRLLVTGLNPHAGEGGHMGHEEMTTITPVIKYFQSQGHDVRGPYPADTLFQPRYLNDCDAVLAMYHDQGLPVLKYASFGHGVNMTLGLPIIRTSVDHGTALDLAGKNTADVSSMLAAINSAYEMVLASNQLTLKN